MGLCQKRWTSGVGNGEKLNKIALYFAKRKPTSTKLDFLGLIWGDRYGYNLEVFFNIVSLEQGKVTTKFGRCDS